MIFNSARLGAPRLETIMNFPASGSTTRIFIKVIPLALFFASSMPLKAAPRQPVTITCTTNPASIFPGDPVTVTAFAANLDPKLSAVYSWSGTGVTGSGTTATVTTDSLAPGTYTVNCGVKEGKLSKEGQKPWQTASGSATFTVKAFEPPTISVSVRPSTIKPGETSTITANGVSPQNRPLTYSYSASAGTVSGSGNSVVYSSSGAPTGTVAITGSATDDKGHTATFTTSVTIQAPYAPPAPHPILPRFPWPPPRDSTSRVLPAWPRGPHMSTFGDIDTKLTSALDAKGYTERSYYSVPGGFALITRLEQIYPDGRSKRPPDRFSAELLPASNFSDYLFALFHADPGYYRVIVFIVTDQVFVEGQHAPEQSDLTGLLAAGAKFLPDPLASQNLAHGVRCAALIYEFKMDNSGPAPSRQAQPQQPQLIPSTTDSIAQLQRAGLWQTLAH